MTSPATIQRVKASIDLAALIADYVPLKKRGSRWTGRCPFHKERTASFGVHDSFYKCFGCGAGGDCFTFLAAIEEIPFSEALKRLAARSGVALDSTPLAPHQLVYAREEAEFCRWWVRDIKAQILWLANWEAEGDNWELACTLGDLSASIRSMSPGDTFQLFRATHTTRDRKRWAVWVAEEKSTEEFFRGVYEAR